MPSAAIKQLLKNNRIWQASEKQRARPALSSGYQALDEKLHYSGWPQGAVSELLLAANGCGELRLLAPLMAKLSQQSGYLCWINPPYQPYAPALSYLGININKLIIIHTRSNLDTIWTAQQAMNSKACSLVLTWLPKKSLSKEMRKLCLAAENSQCWGVTLRHQSLAEASSPAALRIVLQPRQVSKTVTNQRFNQLSIIKQPGGWSGQQVKLNLYPESIYWTSQPVNLWPTLNLQSEHTNQAAINHPPSAEQHSLIANLERSVRKGKPTDRLVNGDQQGQFSSSPSSNKHSSINTPLH
jgi:hypothetical protein